MKKIIYTVLILLYILLMLIIVGSGALSYGAISEDADCTDGVCNLGAGQEYTTWAAFWNDLDATLTGDITLLVEPQVFTETAYPATVTENLAGYTIHVKPTYSYYFPTSSDITTGPRFDLQYTSSDEFLNLNTAGAGQIIIEGLSIYSTTSGKTPPAAYFLNTNAGTAIVTLRRLSIKGDGATNTQYGIQENTAAASPLKVYNNYIYDVYDGIYLSTDLAAGSFIANNTIYGCEYKGIDANSYSALIFNNIMHNSPLLDVNGAIGYNNLCNDTTCEDADFSTGANNQDNLPVVFTDEANDEYFLAGTASNAIDDGLGDHSSYDATLVAYYKFEPGALTTDSSDNSNILDVSSGTPALSSASIVEDGCVTFDDDERYGRAHTDLSSDFPGKGSNKDLTVCMWYRPAAGADGAFAGLASIMNVGSATIWGILKDTNNDVGFYKGYNNGASYETVTETSADLICDGAHWYHICVSYDDYGSDSANTGVTKIRVYDFTANSAITKDDSTMDYTMVINDTPAFYVNSYLWADTAYGEASEIDDVRIYNSALSFAAMAEIQALRFYKDGMTQGRLANYDIGADEYRLNESYYIKNGGSDANTGSWDGAAWATLAKATAATNRGDTINLKKDSTWTGVTYYIPFPGQTIQPYGTGADPIIDINDAADHGIYGGYFIDDITIDGIEIIGWKDTGISVKYSKGWTIKNCTISSIEVGDTNDGWHQGEGIFVYNDGAGYVNVSGITLQDNTFEGEFMGVIYDDWLNLSYKCILIIGMSDVTITGNTMDPGVYTGGIYVGWNSITEEKAENVTIEDNVISSSYSGIYLVGLSGINSICNNIITDSDFTSILAADFAGTTLMGWNDIHGGYGCGINLNRCDNTYIVYNLVYDKDIFEGAKLGGVDLYNGVDISRYCDDGLVYQNTIYNVYGCCLTLEAFTTQPCMNWFVRNNILDASANYPVVGPVSRAPLYYEYNGDQNLNSDYNILRHYDVQGAAAINYDSGFESLTLAEWRTFLGTELGQTDYDANSLDIDPKFVTPGTDFTLQPDSPCIDMGVDLSAYFDGTPPYLDFYGNSVPVYGSSYLTPDTGHYEYSTGFEWGDASAENYYHYDGWTTEGLWSGNGAITGDPDTGTLEMDVNEYVLGPVKDLGSTKTKYLSLTYNETGSGTYCWRGASTSFEKTATSPEWSIYAPGNKDWRYMQIGLDNQAASCSHLP